MGVLAFAGLFAASLMVSGLAAAADGSREKEKPGLKDRAAYHAAYREGMQRFNEACKTAGKSMPASTKRVPGIRLDLAPGTRSFEQGSIDPNWPFAGMPGERMGDRFIASFLDFTFGDSDLHADFGGRTAMTVTMKGFEAIDVLQKDGTYLRYRLKGKSPSEGMVSEPVSRDRAFRHVVSIEPLQIAGGRPHWVGGSRLRVVDGETGTAMGELRAVAFALPPEGVKESELDKRSWARSMTCPRYLDIQSAMARMSLIGIIDPPRYSSGPAHAPSASLEEAVASGVLREATWADVDAWQAAVEASPPTGAVSPGSARPRPKPFRSGEPVRSYVVLKPFALPPGLHGAHSVQLYVPRGVPRPTGKFGHSSVYDFNTMSCEGSDCGRRQ